MVTGSTGESRKTSDGIIDMNYKMYDPALGMMLGPDNFVSQPFNTQNYNRYAYALNNPLLYTDPTALDLDQVRGQHPEVTGGHKVRASVIISWLKSNNIRQVQKSRAGHPLLDL